MSLVDILFGELDSYKAAARTAVTSADAGDGLGTFVDTDLVLVQPLSHSFQIKHRAALITYAATQVHQEYGAVARLWQVCVDEAILGCEPDCLFKQLTPVVLNEKGGSIADQTAELAFTRLPTLFKKFTAKAWALFWACFLRVNAGPGTSEPVALPVESIRFEDLLWDLLVSVSGPSCFVCIGAHADVVRCVWCDAWQVEDATVAREVMTAVVSIYCTSQADATKPASKSRLVELCMSRLQRHTDSPHAMDAVLTLLHTLQLTPAQLMRVGHLRATQQWRVMLCYSDGDIMKTILLPPNPTVGQIRVAIAGRIKFPPEKVRILRGEGKDGLACEEWDHQPYSRTGMPAFIVRATPLLKAMPDTLKFDAVKIFSDTVDGIATEELAALMRSRPEYVAVLKAATDSRPDFRVPLFPLMKALDMVAPEIVEEVSTVNEIVQVWSSRSGRGCVDA